MTTKTDSGPSRRGRLRRAVGHPKVAIGGVMVLCFVFVAIFAPWLAPNNPNAQDLMATLLPPVWDAGGMAQFPLGTDSLGRCVLSRLIYGSRIALLVAVLAATGAMVFGSVLAVLAGYLRGRFDTTMGFLVGLWLSVPPVVFSMLLMVGLGTGVRNVILAVVLVDWTRFYRVVRAEVLVAREREYVQAARLLGFSHWRTMTREILPGVLPLILTLFSLQMGVAIIVEAILSFVGLSVPSDVVAWGVMLADGRDQIYQAGWTLLAPIGGIIFAVLAFNLLSDGLRATLDPRLQKRS
ncbi:ABC transporter permease [Pusillimonas sp. CC-YST705]|uniref:ABC transporter permease n=1 Tax=Mesopusillimonas faecipullorum TaxID=2755040 RepID=A0ABS8C8X4_9BURK|nr:ABC transporter permease [Mesopusillimonas faecipullorum]MCB5362480.1 ABC transporter permease [Mesopusillimonas faecipullorum]